jgi:hypothetical protein
MASEEDQYEKMMNGLMEWQADSFTRMNTYTNLVMGGGYVSAFALWSFAKPAISVRGSATLALLLGISLVSFFALEIFKMVFNMLEQDKHATLIGTSKTPREWVTRYNAMKLEEQTTHRKFMIPFWKISFTISVTTAVAAAILLFSDCVAVIFQLTP